MMVDNDNIDESMCWLVHHLHLLLIAVIRPYFLLNSSFYNYSDMFTFHGIHSLGIMVICTTRVTLIKWRSLQLIPILPFNFHYFNFYTVCFYGALWHTYLAFLYIVYAGKVSV